MKDTVQEEVEAMNQETINQLYPEEKASESKNNTNSPFSMLLGQNTQ